MSYLYETHLHTSQASACGVSPGREYVERYLDLGYTGIIVTDHFYRGNTAIAKYLPWDKWVNKFCQGYEDAAEEGEHYGLDVFFGWEETFQGDDYLVYGLGKEWLLEHPEVRYWTRREQFEEVRRHGGCVVRAHPFRQAYYIDCIRFSLGSVDAIEIANAGNEPSSDALARVYAGKFGLPATAGSDIHYAGDIRQNTVFGVYLEKKMKSISDYVAAIRGNAIGGLKFPSGRCDLYGNERVRLPVEIRDERDQIVRTSLEEFLGLRS